MGTELQFLEIVMATALVNQEGKLAELAIVAGKRRLNVLEHCLANRARHMAVNVFILMLRMGSQRARKNCQE